MPQWRKFHTKAVDSIDLAEMPDDFTRLTWVMLPLVLDRCGRGVDNANWLRSKVYPMRDDVTNDQIAAALDWYAGRGMIERYSVDGRAYFWIPTWHTYQGDTKREADSLLPAPESYSDYGKEENESESRASQEEVVSKSSLDSDVDSDVDSISAGAGENPPELTGEAAIVAFFGEKPKREPIQTTNWTENAAVPWRDWSQGNFRERDGVSVTAQDRIGWLVEDITGLRPPGNYSGWANGCIAVYNAGRGDWDVIEAAIRTAWGRESQYRPSTLSCTKKNADQNGFVKAAGKAWAEKQSKPSRPYSPLDAIPIVRAEV